MAGLPPITFLGLKGSAAWVAAGVSTAAAVGVASKVMPSLFSPGTRSASPSSAGAAQVSSIDQLLSAVTRGGSIAVQAAQAGLGAGAQLGSSGIRLAGDVTQIAGDIARAQSTAIVATNSTLARIVEKATPAAAPLTVQGPTLGPAAPPPVRIPPPVVVTAPIPPPTAVIAPPVLAPPPKVIDAPHRIVEDLAVPAGGVGSVIPKGAVVQDVVIGAVTVPYSLSADAIARGGLN